MIVFSKCAECKHAHDKFRKEREKNEDWSFSCDAYPEGVPFEVYTALESIPCSETVSFEPKY